MKILHLITRRQYRGAEVFAAQLSEELLKDGHRIILAGLYAPPPEPLQVEGALNLDLSDRTPRALPYWSILRAIARLVREEGVDLVQANASDNLKYAVISRLLFRWRARIVFRNASILSAWLRSPLHRVLNVALLRRADAIACVSRLSRQDLLDLGLPEDRLHHLPIGTTIPATVNPVAARAHLRTLASVPAEALVLMHVGAFSPEKNQLALLEVLRQLPPAIDQRRVHLVLIGEGPLREQAATAVGDLRGRVHFLGYRQDVPQLLPSADVFVLPSLIEGTPGVVLEAAAARVPVVAYDVGSVRECLPLSQTANLVVSDVIQEFSDRLQILLSTPDLRDQSGQESYAFVHEHYEIGKVAESFSRLYGQLVLA